MAVPGPEKLPLGQNPCGRPFAGMQARQKVRGNAVFEKMLFSSGPRLRPAQSHNEGVLCMHTYYNSTDPACKQPFGAVTADTEVTIRLTVPEHLG